jgi:putative hydrolase of the HAD superfamily
VSAIPWSEIDTIFLDAGNTLVSMDFAWVVRELTERGVACKVEDVQRAEAAARPAVSEAVGHAGRTEGDDAFAFLLRTLLGRLDAASHLDEERRALLAHELAPVLRSGGSLQLWRWVMPRVPEALRALRVLGLRLVVVSNSDGSVEEILTQLELREYFEQVVDSHRVGFEKPDPRIFHHALEASGARPERTLHVGDIYHADVSGARAAGVHPLLLDPFGDWPEVDCERAEDVFDLAERLRAFRDVPA